MSLIGNSRGNMLINVLVSAAIALIVASAFTTLMANMQKSNKGLAEKMETLHLQHIVMGSMMDSNVCSCNFDPEKNQTNGFPLTFNSNQPNDAKIQLKALYSTCVSNQPGGPLAQANKSLGGSSNIKVSNISLSNIQPTGTTGRFRGEIFIHFDATDLTIARMPARIPINFQADVSSPGQSKIVSCSALSPNFASGIFGSCSQAYTTSSARRPIMLKGDPASVRYTEYVDASQSYGTRNLWGLVCNPGFVKMSCQIATSLGSDSDLWAQPDGCVSDSDEKAYGAEISIVCCPE